MSSSPVLRALREATASAHDALERDARIEPRLADRTTRPAIVTAFHRYHAALEPGVHPMVARLNADLGIGFAPYARVDLIARDLEQLGAKPPPAAALEPPGSIGAALGRMYVAEGSMLGGRIIRRRLAADGHDLVGLSFLDPHGEATGDRWRAFLALLEAARTAGRACIDEVAEGGVQGFAFARRMLDPQAEGQLA